jgi:hypothetical protein
MTRLHRIGASFVVLVLLIVALGGCSSSAAEPAGSAERVLVVAIPGVTWDDVAAGDLPALEAFSADAGVGDVSTRVGRRAASEVEAYLTMGSGTRAVAPDTDAELAVDPDEVVGGATATELQRERLGAPVPGIAYLAMDDATQANDASSFRGEAGLLGDALAAGDVHRAVVANADVLDGGSEDEAYRRGAAAAVVDRAGSVPGGRVGRSLLAEDPAAPGGRRLDQPAVLQAFDAEWQAHDRIVALVEASDLRLSRPGAGDRARALADADALLAALLERVDPDRDAVLVLAPTAPDTLGLVALRSPGIDAGLLRSASTGRAGYVHLADVAPTVLDLVGIEAPTDIEGRPIEAEASDQDRIALLLDRQDGAAVRSDLLPYAVPVLAVLVAVLALTSLARLRRGRPVARWAALGSQAVLGVLAGTFVLGAPGMADQPGGVQLAVVAVLGLATAGGSVLVTRRDPRAGPLVGPLVIVGVIAGDVLTGAHLQLNTIFGYSVSVAGRYRGIGNLAFALLAPAALCAAIAAHDRWQERALPAVSVGLAGVILLEGLPQLGADVGGTLAMVPAYGLAVTVLRGRALRWWLVAAWLVAGALVVGVLGAIDANQSAGAETHLARALGNLADGRLDLVAATLERRVEASFGSPVVLVALVAVCAGAALLARSAMRRRDVAGPMARLAERPVGDRALAVGLVVLAVVGLVANDSTVAVPATMLLVVAPFVVIRTEAAS